MTEQEAIKALEALSKWCLDNCSCDAKTRELQCDCPFLFIYSDGATRCLSSIYQNTFRSGMKHV